MHDIEMPQQPAEPLQQTQQKKFEALPPYGLVLGIILVSTLIKLIDISQLTLWLDETYTFWVANGHSYPVQLNDLPQTIHGMYQSTLAWQPLQWDSLIAILRQNVHMPLYYLLLNPWLGVFGNNTFGLRSFSTFCSALTLLPFAGLAYRMSVSASKQAHTPDQKAVALRIALWSIFFMALVPMQLYYAQEGRMYALAIFWAVSSAWALWELIEACNRPSGSKTKLWGIGALYTLTLLGGIFSHYIFIPYLSFHLVYALLQFFKQPNKNRYAVFILPAVCCLVSLTIWYPTYKLQKQGVVENYHFAKGWMKWIRYSNKFFLMPMESFANNNLFARLFYFPLAAILFVGYFSRRYFGKKESEAEPLIRLRIEGFLLLWLFVPILTQCVYDAVNQTHTTIITRYLLLVTPVMPLIAGLAFSAMAQKYSAAYNRIKLPLIVAVLLFAVASTLNGSPINMHNHKKEVGKAAGYLSDHLLPGDLIFTNGALGTPCLLAFYLEKPHPSQPLIFWMKEYQQQPVPLPPASLMARYKRVWFFDKRSDERRGLDIARKHVSRFFPVRHLDVDPYKELDLYTKHSLDPNTNSLLKR